MPELEPSVLPIAVAASHLEACAAELADARVDDVAELADVTRHLMTSQQHLSAALVGLAAKVRGGYLSGTLAAVPSADLVALTEILQAAATAVGCSADALAESEPLLRILGESAGEDTRL